VVLLPLDLYRVENRVCSSHGVHVTSAAWRVATMIIAGVGDLVQRTGDGRTGQVLGDRVIGRSGDTVCDSVRKFGRTTKIGSHRSRRFFEKFGTNW
jgi:hypothetical protein